MQVLVPLCRLDTFGDGVQAERMGDARIVEVIAWSSGSVVMSHALQYASPLAALVQWLRTVTVRSG